jgi:hypothetical protein
MRRAVLCLALVVSASCATSKPRGPQVAQTHTKPAGCEVLGPVKGSDTSIEPGKKWEHMQHGPSKEAAIADALQQAGAMGATHAHLEKPVPQDRGYYVEGWAYDCSARPAAAPAAAPAPSADPAVQTTATPGAAPGWWGCSKDTDCKGDRICRDRECVDP